MACCAMDWMAGLYNRSDQRITLLVNWKAAFMNQLAKPLNIALSCLLSLALCVGFMPPLALADSFSAARVATESLNSELISMDKVYYSSPGLVYYENPEDVFYKLHYPIGNITLVKGVDYEIIGYRKIVELPDGTEEQQETVSKPNNDGTWNVIIQGLGRFFGTKSIRFDFNKQGLDLYFAKVDEHETAYIHTGKDIQPVLTVKSSLGITLQEGIDYEIQLQDKDLSTLGNHYGYIIPAQGSSYFGKKYFRYAICSGYDLTYAKTDLTEPKYVVQTVPHPRSSGSVYSWTGNPIEPISAVYDLEGNFLSRGTDYSITYEKEGSDSKLLECIEEGMYKVTVEGIGRYSGSQSCWIQVVKPEHDLANARVTGIKSKYDYTGSYIAEPNTECIVEIDGKELTIQKDFLTWPIAYWNGQIGWSPSGGCYVVPGHYATSISGQGQYYGQLLISWDIVDSGNQAASTSPVPTDVNTCDISHIPNQIYDGRAKTPKPSIKFGSNKLTEGIDYTIEYHQNINVGTAHVLVIGKGSYTGTKSATFKISPANLKGAKASGLVSKAYTGKAIKQVPTVKLGTLTLKNGRDFTAAYKNNKKVGVATVTVKGKGNFTGTKSATFKIVKHKQPMKVRIAKKTSTVKASSLKKKAITLACPIKVAKAKGKVTFANASTAKIAKTFKVSTKTGKMTIPKATKKGVYTVKVKVTAAGSGQYAYGSKNVTVKIKVK